MQFHIDAFCAQVEGVFLLGGVMPARSKSQYRKARALLARGKDGWAKELVEKTHTLKGLPQRVKKGKK